MRFYEFEALTPGPSPAKRERGVRPGGRGEGHIRPRSPSGVRTAARRMRKEPTDSEGLHWSALRDRRLAGRKFRRQHPAGRFVLDFYCHEERLAVEIDGPIHQGKSAADRERQFILESMGIRFLRLPSELVEDRLQAALAAIKRALTPGPSPASRERVARRVG